MLPGRRRVILPLEGTERARALGLVARLSRGLQCEPESHLRMEDALKRLGRFGQPAIAAQFRPCFEAAVRKRNRPGQPFDCRIGESAACSYCQLEAQLRLVDWIRNEPRMQTTPLALTISQRRWRAELGQLGFPLKRAKRELRVALREVQAKVHAIGRFEFCVAGTEDGLRWQPHAHLLLAGEGAQEGVEALRALSG